MSDTNCIFCNIANKQVNTKIILETDDYIAFNDINQQAPVHALIIPKKHFASLNEAKDPELLGKLLLGVKEVSKKLGIEDGYRTVINTGEKVGQTVFHMHIHVLGGRTFKWPPG